jgi:hypothetical protein
LNPPLVVVASSAYRNQRILFTSGRGGTKLNQCINNYNKNKALIMHTNIKKQFKNKKLTKKCKNINKIKSKQLTFEKSQRCLDEHYMRQLLIELNQSKGSIWASLY